MSGSTSTAAEIDSCLDRGANVVKSDWKIKSMISLAKFCDLIGQSELKMSF